MPIIVAFGIFFSGFLILSAGIVADSIPKNAKNVNAVVIVIASKFVSWEILIGVKLDKSKTKKLIKIVNKRGKTLSIEVINWNLPTFLIPLKFKKPIKKIIVIAKGKLNLVFSKSLIKIV